MYRITTDQQSQPQIDALPPEALAPFAEVRATLEVAPWTAGDSLNDNNPDGAVRTLVFGPDRQGMVTYLVLDEQRRVDLLDVLWLS
ncbi:hypothetical protein [Pseudonocardia nigra]|uniref:hypothetical protein n=1 Tax=Pseudonocardia nigra TaxID=1921578 RepID=UPI001FE46648|nr:hypothetical protein [Pseudonocardia nigra]